VNGGRVGERHGGRRCERLVELALHVDVDVEMVGLAGVDRGAQPDERLAGQCVVDLALRGRLGLIARLDFYSMMFLLEMALFLAPALLLLSRRGRYNPGIELISAILMMLAGSLYRFDTFLVGFNPGPGWSYFPTIPEMTVTIGFVAFEVLAYLFIVKQFPILHSGTPVPALAAAATKSSG